MKYILFVLIIALVSCQDGNKSNNEDTPTPAYALNLSINHKVESNLLVLDEEYKNSLGQPFKIQKYKYYLSNITLIDTATSQATKLEDIYKLVEVKSKEPSLLRVDVPSNIKFNSMQFYVGIDSARNLDIAQVDDLDPSNGMSWNWNTGYKFLLLEGEWFKNDSRKGLIYHIGTSSNFTKVTLIWDKYYSTDGENALPIKIDMKQFFETPHKLDFDKNSEIMIHPDSYKVMQNFANAIGVE